MGTVLVIKNADFSDNAVSFENVYNIVKQTDIDVATPAYALGTQRWYNSIPASEKITIYAISFVLAMQETYSTSGNITVGATDGTTPLRSVAIPAVDIVEKITKLGLAAGDRFDVVLNEPLVVNAGEYVYAAGNNSLACYARAKSGDYGNMQIIGGSATDYNLAMTFYGE